MTARGRNAQAYRTSGHAADRAGPYWGLSLSCPTGSLRAQAVLEALFGRLTKATLVTEGSQGSGRYGAERPFCTAVDLSALIS